MLRRLVCLFAAVFGSTLLPAQTTSAADPKRVLVVYASNYPDLNGDGTGDSLELANYYAKARGVPAANLLGLKFKYPLDDYFSGSSAWATFHAELVTPVRDALKQIGGTKIDTILFLLGVPFNITTTASVDAERSVDDLMRVPGYLGTSSSWGHSGGFIANPYFEHSPTVGSDQGPFQHVNIKYGSHDYYLVSRLDGLHVEACKDLIDGARYFEIFGPKGDGAVAGNIVVDTRFGSLTDSYLKTNYPDFPNKQTYELWDQRMAFGKFVATTLSLPLLWESTSNEIGISGAKWADGKAALKVTDALLYGGWYNYCRYLDVFDWLPGSVGTDLNSNSLSRFRESGYRMRSFGSGAMTKGLTAVVGALSEPYLDGHVRPEVLLHYLAKGVTFAEAAAIANPVMCWRGIQVGDPLYAPFRTSGYTRKKDTTAPAAGKSSIAGRGGSSIGLDIGMLRRDGDPELARIELDWGNDRSLSTQLVQDRAFRSRHDITVDNLDASEPGYYFRPTFIDPAGNRTVGDIWAMTPRAFTTVDARVKVQQPTLKRGDWLDLRFAVATVSDLTKLTQIKVELQQGATTSAFVDVTGHVIAMAAQAAAGPRFESALFRIHAPFFLVGSFQVRITAGLGSAVSSHSAVFTVQ